MPISTEHPTSKNFGIISIEGKDNGSFPVNNKCDDMILACNGKSYTRPDFSFYKFLMHDLSTITDFKNFEYTIPTIPFFDDDYSLFMSEQYYETTSKVDRAWWFLDCLANHDARQMVKELMSNEPFVFTTEICALYAGVVLSYNAIFHTNKNERRNSKTLPWILRWTKADKDLGNDYFWEGSFNNSPNPYTREWLMRRFNNWLNDTSSTGFTGIENSFALHDSNGVLFDTEKLKVFKKAIKNGSDEDVYNLVDINFRKNYCKVNQNYMLL